MSVDANWRESIGYSQSVRNQRLTDSPPRMNRYWMFTWAGMIFMARRVSPGSPMVSPQMEREGSDQLGRRRLLLPHFWKSCEILWLHCSATRLLRNWDRIIEKKSRVSKK